MAEEQLVNGVDPSSVAQESGARADTRQLHLVACRQAVNEDPRNVVLLNELGLAAEAAGDLDRARWAYRRAARLDPSFGPAYQNLGLLLQREGKIKPAIQSFENCLKFGGRDCDRELIQKLIIQLRQGAGTSEDDPLDILESMLQTESTGQESQLIEDGQLTAINPAITRSLTQIGLTPAEALLLMDPDGSDGREMVRYTVLDLINKEVLALNNQDQISRGQKFDRVALERHENFLANYFARFDLGIDLTQYAHIILTRLGNRYGAFKGNLVRQALLDKGYLAITKDTWLGFIPVRRYTLTPEGLRVMHQLKRQLKRSASLLQRLIHRDPELAKAYIAQAGPALLLLNEVGEGAFEDWFHLLDSMGFDEYSSGNTPLRLPQNADELAEMFVQWISGK